jgi:ketosteroid isomerase-like protein
MKKCLVVPLAGLAISFALPTYAQQKDVADPQTTQKILATVKAVVEGHNNNDPAAIAALYTHDAVFLTPEGLITGRQAIQKWFTDLYQWWHPKNHIVKVDGNAFHLIGTVGNELWATGESSETGQGKAGEPIPVKFHWLCIFVREGDDWKILAWARNQTPESVIRIYKSFTQQPAATPSSTASPSNQQKDLADSQTTQKLFALSKASGETQINHDAAGFAALHTRDAVFLTPEGPIIGRQAIQKWYTDLWQFWHPTNCIVKVDGNAFHLIGTVGNELWATGEFIATGQGENGEPIPTKNRWLCIYVREGEDWKIRVNAWGQTAESLIHDYKRSVQQPAATPSPTASPSSQ